MEGKGGWGVANAQSITLGGHPGIGVKVAVAGGSGDPRGGAELSRVPPRGLPNLEGEATPWTLSPSLATETSVQPLGRRDRRPPPSAPVQPPPPCPRPPPASHALRLTRLLCAAQCGAGARLAAEVGGRAEQRQLPVARALFRAALAVLPGRNGRSWACLWGPSSALFGSEG